MLPLVGVPARQLGLDAGGVDDGKARGVYQGGDLGVLPGLDDAAEGDEQAGGADVIQVALHGANLGDPLGHLVLQREAAGVAPVAHEAGALIGVDQ